MNDGKHGHLCSETLSSIVRRAARARRRRRGYPAAAGAEALERRVLFSGDALGGIGADVYAEPRIAALLADPDLDVDRTAVRGSDRLTLRKNGDNLELVDKKGNVLFSEVADDVNSVSITGRADKTDQLIIDFAFGGSFDLAGGVTYNAGGGRGTDRVTFMGEAGGNALALNGQNLTAEGTTVFNVGVERLYVKTGAGDDQIAFAGAPSFSLLDVRDAAGNDTYDIGITGGRFKLRDSGGDDHYQLTPTGGTAIVKDSGVGFDVIDFADAPNGVGFVANGRLQGIGLGNAMVRMGGRFETLLGSPFADDLTGDSKGNLLLGGGGADTLDGGKGHDILIGNDGLDGLAGGSGEDILIGGGTAFDDDSDGLQTLLEKWTARGKFANRVENVRYPGEVDDNVYLVSGGTVFDDAAADVLDGGKSSDFTPLGEGDGNVANVELTAAPVLPDFDDATFSDSLTIDNTYLPFRLGARFVYEGEKEEDGEVEVERVEREVTDTTRVVMGVTVRGVRDREFVNGVLMEDTLDYFAQDDDGNVWYFGEDVTNFEYDDDGNLIGTNNEGAWIAGENGALPGIVMRGEPTVGDNHYQEFAPLDDAIDQAVTQALDGEVSGPLGEYSEVVVEREFTELEPDALENKHYAPGLGLVLVEEDLDEEGEPGFIMELISFSLSEPPTLADFSQTEFSNPLTIDNVYMPLPLGATFAFEGESEEDGEVEVERVEREVTDATREILGVTTRGVRDREFINGVLMEDTLDYFAQDDDGNVWYFGEDVVNFEYDDEGNLVGTNDDGSWIAGENSAFAGIIMLSNPQVGGNHYQEYGPLDEALDQAIVLELGGQVSIDFGDFINVLVTRELTEVEPDQMENKNYAPNVGLVLVEEDFDEQGEPQFTLELVETSLEA